MVDNIGDPRLPDITGAALSILRAIGDEGTISRTSDDGQSASLVGYAIEDASRSANIVQLLERMPFAAAAYDRNGNLIGASDPDSGFPEQIKPSDNPTVECQFDGERLLLVSNIDPERSRAGLRRIALSVGRPEVDEALGLQMRGESLTAAEFRLFAMMISGNSLKEVADQDGVSHQTRRKQLQSIFDKSGFASQAELSRRLLFALLDSVLRALTRPTQTDADIRFLQSSYGDDLSIHDIGVGNGRLRLFDIGPRSGRPILLIHPMLFPALPLPDHIGSLRERGLRVLVPLRDGFDGSALGVSSRTTTSAVTSHFAAAAAEAVQLFGLSRLPVVSVVFGAPWAVELASRFPDIIQRIVFVAAPTPIGRIPTNRPMSFTRSLVPFALRMPQAAEALVRLHARMLRSNQLAAAGFRLAYREGTADSKTIRDLLAKGWLQSWVRHILTYSVAGIANDLRTNTKDWSSELGQLSCPLTFLHGEDDQVSPIEHIEYLADLHPHANLVRCADRGQLFYLDAPNLIFDQL